MLTEIAFYLYYCSIEKRVDAEEVSFVILANRFVVFLFNAAKFNRFLIKVYIKYSIVKAILARAIAAKIFDKRMFGI